MTAPQSQQSQESQQLHEEKVVVLMADQIAGPRALQLGVDSAGGFAVAYQLDGSKPKRPKPRK